jgi:hypothetical protein
VSIIAEVSFIAPPSLPAGDDVKLEGKQEVGQGSMELVSQDKTPGLLAQPQPLMFWGGECKRNVAPLPPFVTRTLLFHWLEKKEKVEFCPAPVPVMFFHVLFFHGMGMTKILEGGGHGLRERKI